MSQKLEAAIDALSMDSSFTHEDLVMLRNSYGCAELITKLMDAAPWLYERGYEDGLYEEENTE